MKTATTSRVLAVSMWLLSYSIATVEGFNSAPSHKQLHRRQNDAVLTKLDATSFEEDLALTLKVIMDHQDRSVTVSKEQLIQQMEEAEKAEKETAETIDISVPYDAAARLAYEALEDKKGISYEEFQVQYIKDSVAMVKSKQPKKEADDAPPLVSASIDTATSSEPTVSETKATDEKSTLQPILNMLWKKVSSLGKSVSKA